jgi:type II secretory pathway pseudopilin PulG
MRPAGCAHHAFARRGITLSETLVVAIATGVLITLVMLGMDGIRTELKRQQTMALLETLDQALLAYYQGTGSWPADPGPFARSYPDVLRQPDPDSDGSGDRVINLLAAVPACRVVLATIPEILRPAPEGETREIRSGSVTVVDAWGRSLSCLTAASSSPMHRKAVAANENRPVFISPGPDGRLGFTDVATASDNVRSDETRQAAASQPADRP